jgi:hypothetical protein
VRLDKLHTVAKAEFVDRQELRTILRSLSVNVVIDWERNQLVFNWKHGGRSAVPVVMKPQRIVANVRRADRPRFKPVQMAPPLPAVKR